MKIYDVKSHLKLKFFKNMHFGHFCITEGDRTFSITVTHPIPKDYLDLFSIQPYNLSLGIDFLIEIVHGLEYLDRYIMPLFRCNIIPWHT